MTGTMTMVIIARSGDQVPCATTISTITMQEVRWCAIHVHVQVVIVGIAGHVLGGDNDLLFT